MLKGNLTVSSPWTLSSSEFRVPAGGMGNVSVVFQPNEPKAFVGQVALTNSNGETATVALTGKATAPLVVSPNPVLLRNATVTLTNQTEWALPLMFQTSPQLQPIAAVEVPARGEVEVEVAVRPETTEAVHEAVAIVGPRFTMPLAIDAPGTAPKAEAIAKSEPLPTVAETAARIAQSTPSVAQPLPGIIAEPEVAAPTGKVIAHRLGRGRWELRWPAQTTAPSSYRIDERQLALDAAANWPSPGVR